MTNVTSMRDLAHLSHLANGVKRPCLRIGLDLPPSGPPWVLRI